ncbi:MAG: hypothetical protein A2Y66_07580 [Nitrospirae bacterium RBG_13_41_22]|nr:MAG: hypothetical protein A2Y66_07580 [Nitrospirae bacterium RBG_13_41_22]
MAGTPDCRNRNTYNHTTKNLQERFLKHGHRLQKVKELALQIKDGIEKISPFIQQTTQTVCPECKNVCCISKHGYYNYEDLIYLHALSLRPPDYEFEIKDEDPCQFLSESGCSLDRPFRPSGCNWYFCESLLEHMEKKPDYQEFDNSLSEIAKLWMEMIDEFVNP